MYSIKKKFTFSAAHQLNNMPENHPCGHLHGHNYVVELCLRRQELTTHEQWVRDYRELDVFKDFIDNDVDHKNLNDVFNGAQTTAEVLAWMFFMWCRRQGWDDVYAVRVSETPKTWAEYNQDVTR